MDESEARRLAENEVIFRKANQEVQDRIASLKDSDRAEGISPLIADDPVHFYCECSSEKCRERVKLRPSKYKQLHQNSSQFVMLPGHNIPVIERIMQETPDYIVVEKFVTPPSDTSDLNET